jgi:ABC-type nitrate/sulfonate/bicarbonate transport system substrate-binding protein
MKSLKKTALAALVLSLTVSSVLFAGGKADKKAVSAGGKSYHLTISGIAGSLNYLPVYIAQEKGWFAEEGFTFDEVLFSNGPVQMESLASNGWDLGATGVGGVLSGAIGYDAVVVGASNSDNGTQYVFARNNSDIVKAGTGHNTADPRIYGDAASWKGKRVLCNTGTVLQYLLIKTLAGFGLNPSDVTFIAMDAPTAYSAFLSGQGDLCVLTGSSGTFKMLEDKANFTAVSCGDWAKTGLMCNFMANKNSLANPVKYEAMTVFLKVYFKTLDWMKNNFAAAVDLLVDFSEESGNTMARETAAVYLKADTYYTLQEAVDMINTKAPGKNYSIMEDRLLGVLNFFIEFGNYKKGDDAQFAGKTNAALLNDVRKDAASN